jgi:hypothetical protein
MEEVYEGFTRVYLDINTGGCVYRHELVKQTVDDYDEVYEIAIDFAQQGCTVKMLPILDPDHPLREQVFGGAKENKCPDLSVNGEYVDVKTPDPDPSINALDNNVKKGAKQANIVVVRVLGSVKSKELFPIAKFRFAKHSSLLQIKFKVIGKKTYTYDRVNFTR